jgi:hypothetical protein
MVKTFLNLNNFFITFFAIPVLFIFSLNQHNLLLLSITNFYIMYTICTWLNTNSEHKTNNKIKWIYMSILWSLTTFIFYHFSF